MSTMLRSSGAMGAATLASRLLGLVREMVYARFMGSGAVAGAFFFAYMIPNLFRRLLGEGALTAAFLPVFKQKERQEGEQRMWEAANAVLSGLIMVSCGVIALVILGLTVFLRWGDLAAETRLMLELLRIMFPYMLLVCLTAVFMGMLNARGFFFLPALGAGILNVVMILSVFFLAPAFGQSLDEQIYALAYAILLAGVAQATFQLPTLVRNGFRFRWVTPWTHPTVRYVLRQMVPGTVGVAAFQLNMLLTQGIAFWVGASIVASFNYAVRLMEFPQGVFSVSIATFILPTLSGLAADKKYSEFRETVIQGLTYLGFIHLFAAGMMVILAEPIVRLLFEYGEFGPLATRRTAFALACLGPALIAYSMVNVLVRSFHALGDIRTPMKISVACLALNLLFAAWLVWPLQAGGLGLANSFSSLINVGLLLYALQRKLKRLDWTAARTQMLRLLPVAALAWAVAGGSLLGWDSQFPNRETLGARLGAVFVPMALAGGVYMVGAWKLKVSAAQEVMQLLRAAVRRSPR